MTESLTHGLLAAYRKLLQPLVRILIRHGVSYAELSEILKNVFVEVAERDFRLAERRNSQSRIAILTGLSRKEVAKQKGILDSGGALDIVSNLNRVARVLEGWHTDAFFTGVYGMPLDIPFDSDGGPSITELVRRHSGDMAPRAMLDELLRVGAVQHLASGAFKVLMRVYLPEQLRPDALQRFGEVVRDFVSTYEYNMTKKGGPGRFERIVYAANGLRPELLPAFEALIKTKGHNLLIELDNWISAQESKSGTKPETRNVRTGVGIYHYVGDDDE
jgi:hypothetical protein